MGKLLVLQTSSELLDAFLVPSLRGAGAYKIDTPTVNIKLDQNETPFDWPENLKSEVLEKLKAMPWNRYPSAFTPMVTEMLAEYAHVPAENIMTGPGTNHLIALFLSTLTRQLQGKVIIAQPSFPLYESHCSYEGVPYEVWPLNNDLAYDLTLLPDVPENSLIVFASPNNPTGSIVSLEQLSKLLEDNPSSFVLADEAYFEFAPFSYTQLLSKYPNLIILRTCSKTLGAAGVRLGYAIAGKELIQELSKLRLPYLLNQFTIAASEVFFGSSELQKRVGEHVDMIVQERERIITALRSLTSSKARVFDSFANFFLLKLEDQAACQEFYEGLIKAGILVRNVSRGPQLSGCLRVTVGLPKENDQLISACTNLLK